MVDFIEDGVVVMFDYVIRDASGEVLDASTDDEPGCYLHGAGNVSTGLEVALLGGRVGDTVNVVVSAEDGFGAHDGRDAFVVSRDRFPSDIDLIPGMQCSGQDPEEVLWIVDANDKEVTLDTNHPLAGQSVSYQVTIRAIRAATPDEREAGEPLIDSPTSPRESSDPD